MFFPISVESQRGVGTTAISSRRSQLYVAICIVNFVTGCGFLSAAIDGCRRCHVAATTVDVSRTFAANMGQVPHVHVRFFIFRITAGCRGVVGSSCYRMHSGTLCDSTCVNHFAKLSPDNRGTALRKVCLMKTL